MDCNRAKAALANYYGLQNPSEDDDFIYTEALSYLIEETKVPRYMCELGWYYSAKKRFDLELKYLEMAAGYGYLPAMEELGYMWYHGQHGEKDYDKAFFYFTKGAEGDGKSGSLWCKCKLADMYRYGCSVEKDEGKYRKMIEEAYEEVKHPQFLGDPFWGHIEVMGRIVRLLYQITPYEADRSDFYDLFYLTERPGKYTMKRKGKKTRIIVTEEGGERAIGCGGKWYRSFEEFCWKAETGNERYTYIYDEFYGLEVER